MAQLKYELRGDVFEGLKKKPYATVPIEAMETFLKLGNEKKAAAAAWAYLKYFFFGIEEPPDEILVAWDLLTDKADRMLDGVRNVKKRADRKSISGASVDATDGASLGASVGASSVCDGNHNHNHNHNQNHNPTPGVGGAAEPPTLGEVEELFSKQLNDPAKALPFYEYGVENGWDIPGIHNGLTAAAINWKTTIMH